MRAFPISVLLSVTVAAAWAEVPDLAPILTVAAEGKGNAEAAVAWQSAVDKATVADIPALLRSMDKAGPLATNWILAAVSAVVDRAAAEKKPLPLTDLEAFVKDTARSAAGRHAALDMLEKHDEARFTSVRAALLLDPSQEMRRPAVEALLNEAKKADEAAQEAIYRKAFEAARDDDQVRAATDGLRDLGQEVDVPRHFGFLMNWKVIGPFDNKGRNGFDTVFPPEKELKTAALYDGKESGDGPARIGWTDFVSESEFGIVDFNRPIGMLKEVTGYAFTEFVSETERDAEIRLGCKNAWKVWCNGELLFGRDEYHRGMAIDQYRMPVKLKKGPNTILVKCCQNEQTETWTVEWNFQLRVCDHTGTAILAPDRPKTPEAALKTQEQKK